MHRQAQTQPGMQLVPYAGNLNAAASTQQPKMPLTSDQLTKLYSMGAYGRSPSIPLSSSFNQFGTFPTATTSIQYATSAISAFAPSTFPINSTASNVAAVTSATSYLHQTTTMFAPPPTPSPFSDANALYSPLNVSTGMPQTQLNASFGTNLMTSNDSLFKAGIAPTLPPRQINHVPASIIGDGTQSRPAKKDNANVVHRRTSNVSKPLGDDLIDLDHGIVDK